MTQKSTKLAEIALAMALHDQVAPTIPESRIKGQLKRLYRESIKAVEGWIGPVANDDRREAGRIIARFADVSRWEGKPLHIITKINFMLALYDAIPQTRPHCKALIEPLNEIYKHFAKVGDAPKASEWSAALAAEKWEGTVNASR